MSLDLSAPTDAGDPAISSALSKNTDEKFTKELVDIQQYALTFREQPLFPLSSHDRKLELFGREGLSNYVSHRTILEQFSGAESSRGDSLDAFTVEFSRQVCDERNLVLLAPALAPVARSEMRLPLQRAHRSYSILFLSQRRYRTIQARLQLPSSRDEIRALLTKDARQKIDEIVTPEQAVQFLEFNGHVYIHAVSFGSSEIKTSTTLTRRHLLSIRNSNWETTLGDSIVGCLIKPIYELAKPDSRAEMLLQHAFHRYFRPIADDALYSVQNLSSGELLCLDGGEPSTLRDEVLVRVLVVEDRLCHDQMHSVVVKLSPRDVSLYLEQRGFRRWCNCRASGEVSLRPSYKSLQEERRDLWALIRISSDHFLIRSSQGSFYLRLHSEHGLSHPLLEHVSETVALRNLSFHWKFTEAGWWERNGRIHNTAFTAQGSTFQILDRVEQNDTVVRLAHNKVSDEQVPALVEALANKPRLTLLNLGSNDISDEGAKALAEAVEKHQSLTKLFLNNNSISDDGAKALAEPLANSKSITTLDFSYNSLSDKGVTTLFSALMRSQSLTRLYFSGYAVSDEGAQALAEALPLNDSLAELYLDNNSISDEGVKALAKALMRKQSSLTALHLSSNSISDEGVKALAEALRLNDSLVELYLDNNSIKDEGAKALAEALMHKQSSLIVLHLSSNSISDQGAMALAEALRLNDSLVELNLDLDNNYISDEGAKALGLRR